MIKYRMNTFRDVVQLKSQQRVLGDLSGSAFLIGVGSYIAVSGLLHCCCANLCICHTFRSSLAAALQENARLLQGVCAANVQLLQDKRKNSHPAKIVCQLGGYLEAALEQP